ncbi:hypothetical protein EVAR_4825_1 [Eumeta japonica]|uniref:Uncharacterized protein n=1 Tax=Eumeta variegata TaxID=151549 RepID=A0A4C1T1Q0_EUMVA|nr:hypothetical protein EVAR_4825_1 [Eumeta japonica]
MFFFRSEDVASEQSLVMSVSGGGAGATTAPGEGRCACAAAFPPRRHPHPHEILRPKPRRSRLIYIVISLFSSATKAHRESVRASKARVCSTPPLQQPAAAPADRPPPGPISESLIVMRTRTVDFVPGARNLKPARRPAAAWARCGLTCSPDTSTDNDDFPEN